MGQWLRDAGILTDGWEIDQAQLDDILGIEEPTLEAFAELDAAQIAFARGLARLNVDEISSEKVREYAADIYGVEFPVKSLPKNVLEPLDKAGLITSEKTTGGRGAKPHIVRPTDLLKKEVTDPLLEGIAQSVRAAKYRKLIRLGLNQILDDMALPPKETHKRGLALEALALYLTRIIGLEFRGWRSVPSDRSYEIDALVEGTRLIFSRWQIQCKNTSSVREGDVAKEIGLALRLKSNVILVVTTGTYTKSAKQYARDIMQDTNFNVILMDGKDLAALRDDPSLITRILRREAKRAMAIKQHSLPEHL